MALPSISGSISLPTGARLAFKSAIVVGSVLLVLLSLMIAPASAIEMWLVSGAVGCCFSSGSVLAKADTRAICFRSISSSSCFLRSFSANNSLPAGATDQSDSAEPLSLVGVAGGIREGEGLVAARLVVAVDDLVGAAEVAAGAGDCWVAI